MILQGAFLAQLLNVLIHHFVCKILFNEDLELIADNAMKAQEVNISVKASKKHFLLQQIQIWLEIVEL